jgi:hypothetical protein
VYFRCSQKVDSWMQSFFPSQQDFGEAAWGPGPAELRRISQFPADQAAQPPRDGKDGLRARNRIAAKKWRDKKDDTLYELEATNDQLRREALELRRQVLGLETENHVLEEELRFFQSFMTKIMNVTPKQSGIGRPAWAGF